MPFYSPKSSLYYCIVSKLPWNVYLLASDFNGTDKNELSRVIYYVPIKYDNIQRARRKTRSRASR